MSHAQLLRRLRTWLCEYGNRLGPRAFYAGPREYRARRIAKVGAALDYVMMHDAKSQKRQRHRKRPSGRERSR